MSNIHVKYKHSLNAEEARKRVEQIAKGLKKEYKIEYVWKGDRLLFKRSGAAGYLDLGDGAIAGVRAGPSTLAAVLLAGVLALPGLALLARFALVQEFARGEGNIAQTTASSSGNIICGGLVAPIPALATLSVSGLATDAFIFLGFPPRKPRRSVSGNPAGSLRPGRMSRPICRLSCPPTSPSGCAANAPTSSSCNRPCKEAPISRASFLRKEFVTNKGVRCATSISPVGCSSILAAT